MLSKILRDKNSPKEKAKKGDREHEKERQWKIGERPNNFIDWFNMETDWNPRCNV